MKSTSVLNFVQGECLKIPSSSRNQYNYLKEAREVGLVIRSLYWVLAVWDDRDVFVAVGSAKIRASSVSCVLTELCRKFLNLSPRTRMLIGLGIVGYSGIGMLVSNGLEKQFGMVASEEDKERLRKVIPKITTLDCDKSESSK